jgi:pimeloyl-ACP methyl ester carboxylesterase
VCVEIPRAVVWGNEDRITPPASCRRIAAVAGVQGVELDQIGHALATEAPTRFNDTLRSLIASTEQGRGSSWT